MNRPIHNPTAPPKESRPGGIPPRSVFVTGPRGAGKTRWMQENILKLVATHPGIRCAVVLAEDGHTRMERFAHEVPGIAVRRVLLPCPCCPAHAFLPETVRQLTSETGADWLFVETPAVATAGLLGEFDRELGWPRQIVLCLDEKWERLRQRDGAPPFLAMLSAHADVVVTAGRPAAAPGHVPLADLPNVVLT